MKQTMTIEEMFLVLDEALDEVTDDIHDELLDEHKDVFSRISLLRNIEALKVRLYAKLND